jgi:hypothetical protein
MFLSVQPFNFATLTNCLYSKLPYQLTYVITNYVFGLLCIDGATANGLTELLMGALSTKGGLPDDAIAYKILCFGADGISAFQGKKTGITIQIKNKFAPFVAGIQCHAHKINLAVKTLSQLSIFQAVEDLMRLSHAYFAHSPKKYTEYRAFVQTIDTKGLKLLKNVKTRWLSLLEPMRRLMNEFRTIVGKMHIDSLNKKEKVSYLLSPASFL